MKNEFIDKFGDKIHVCFNWKWFDSEDFKIIAKEFLFIDQNNWFTPWYVDDNGSEVSWCYRDSKPLSIGDAINSQVIIRNKYDHIAKHKFNCDIYDIDIPMYFLGDNKYLLLDGNHRLMGLLLNGIKANVYGYVIYGPITERMIPDLRHYQVAI